MRGQTRPDEIDRVALWIVLATLGAWALAALAGMV